MARSVFRVEQGIQLKHARKFRAVLLPEGLNETPVAIDDWWYPLRVSAVLGGGPITRHWSRYWPLTTGYVLQEGPEDGKAYNPLATMFIGLPEGVEAVYGPSLLIGFDPTRREYCSVADIVLPTIVAARDELLQTVPSNT